MTLAVDRAVKPQHKQTNKTNFREVTAIFGVSEFLEILWYFRLKSRKSWRESNIKHSSFRNWYYRLVVLPRPSNLAQSVFHSVVILSCLLCPVKQGTSVQWALLTWDYAPISVFPEGVGAGIPWGLLHSQNKPCPQEFDRWLWHRGGTLVSARKSRRNQT